MEMLKSDSRASASGIVFKYSFSVYEYPRVTWRWKAENVYETATLIYGEHPPHSSLNYI
ncbi:MAG: DUF3047 domain-containing protein [Desulfatiglandales bacterium]